VYELSYFLVPCSLDEDENNLAHTRVICQFASVGSPRGVVLHSLQRSRGPHRRKLAPICIYITPLSNILKKSRVYPQKNQSAIIKVTLKLL
jgi:hypothetical protein